MENKLTKEGLIGSSETFLYDKKNLKRIKRVIEKFGVLLRKRGFEEMNVHQMITLALGMIALLMLDYSYGIRLPFVLGVTGITLAGFLALMNIGKR